MMTAPSLLTRCGVPLQPVFLADEVPEFIRTGAWQIICSL